MNSKRVEYIDVLKGFAIILVIIGHIADGYINANIFIDNTSVLKNTYNIIYSFHMPLFLFLSGYVFYLAYFKDKEVDNSRIGTQLLNIFLLYIIFSIIQWCFKYFMGSFVNNKVKISDLAMLLIKPMAPYWYLYNLFFYYIIVLAWEKLSKNRITDLIFGIGTIILSIIFNNISLIYFFNYFFMGICFSKYNLKIKNSLSYCCLIIAFVVMILNLNNPQYLYKIRLVSTIIGLSMSIGIFSIFSNLNIQNRCLRFIGRSSLEIYLVHCYFTSLNRPLLLKIGISNFYINVFMNFIISLIASLIIMQMSKKLKIHKYIFTPGKQIKRREFNV